MEARRIEAFCRQGGTVIADYLPGLWDQHGEGRKDGGALDEMFGVKHAPSLKAADLFGGKLWVETDQDENFNYKSYAALLTNKNTCVKDASGFNLAVRALPASTVHAFGRGRAVLLNLSPQWYNAYRTEGFAPARDHRAAFMRHLSGAGVRRWVELQGASEAEFGYEITYWSKAGRTLLCVCLNPEVAGNSEGGGNAAGLKTAALPVNLHFAAPVKDARDERTGRALGDGADFKLTWVQNEALVVSIEGTAPR